MRAHVVSWSLCNTTLKQPWKREGLGSQWLENPRDFLTRSRTILNLSSGRSSSASLGLNTSLYSTPKTIDSNKVSECPLCLRVWGTLASKDISASKDNAAVKASSRLFLGSAQRLPCFRLTALSCMSHTQSASRCWDSKAPAKGCCQVAKKEVCTRFLQQSLCSGWSFIKMSFTPQFRNSTGGESCPRRECSSFPKRRSKPCICLWVSGAFEVTEAG